ncbi:hypothetical protein [Bacillus clarus]|nr:hypothetical protein [Bacillus clarus]
MELTVIAMTIKTIPKNTINEEEVINNIVLKLKTVLFNFSFL